MQQQLICTVGNEKWVDLCSGELMIEYLRLCCFDRMAAGYQFTLLNQEVIEPENQCQGGRRALVVIGSTCETVSKFQRIPTVDRTILRKVAKLENVPS